MSSGGGGGREGGREGGNQIAMYICSSCTLYLHSNAVGSGEIPGMTCDITSYRDRGRHARIMNALCVSVCVKPEGGGEGGEGKGEGDAQHDLVHS